MFGKILRALGSGIGITVVVTLILSLCLWFLGGYLGIGEAHPFDSVLGRLVGLAVLWILALFVTLIVLVKGKKKDQDLADDIVNSVEASASQEDEIVTAELGEMRTKLKSAMAKLRKSKLGSRHLYELPWYVIIGPPGAGKTTAIVNSGLQFPLADEMGAMAIGGVGGTRNCDWWFTNDAVLVDTAGRYTTQESDADADNAAWMGFLGLLKKHRKRQPINGAIVAISLSDLSMQDATTQKNHAAAVRRRLQELREQLGVHFPVYVLFTKADLIAGFNEFYDRLGKEERGQVWGFTLPLIKSKGDVSPIAGFDDEFSLLLSRLNGQSMARMQEETDHQRRSLIATFPSQVAAVRPVARDFLQELFQDNRYEDRQILRGVYFTSGTQEGTPIDRLMMGMAQTFGIGRQAIGSGTGTGRSYFLTRLFENVIFREAGLVSADDKVERRYRWTKRAAFAATIIGAIGIGSLWGRSYFGNQELLNKTELQLATYQDEHAQIPLSPIGDSDLPSVIPALNILRDLPSNPTFAEVAKPDGLGWGLYQGRYLGNEERQTYRAGLNQHFLPRLLLRLEDQMQGNINNPDLLYEALKVYLILGQSGPLNSDLINEWMDIDWSIAYPGKEREVLRTDLNQHLSALLSQPMKKISLNNDLVSQVQSVLNRMPQAERVYNGIINSPVATSLPKWRLTDFGGPAITRAFKRSSGKELNDGIDGIFTYEGFHNVFLAEALGVATRIQRESWILGEEANTEKSEATLIAMSRDVLDLYYNDYIAQYDNLMADLDIIPLESLSRAVEVTNVLSGPTSPIVNVLNAIADETRLTEDRTPPEDPNAAVAAAGSVSAVIAKQKLNAKSRVLLSALQSSSGNTNGAPPKAPGFYVEDRFSWLQDLVKVEEGQPSQLDGMIVTLTQVYKELNKLSFVGGVAKATEETSALAKFQAQSAALPGPMKRWSTQISVGSSGVAADGTRAGIDARWKADVLPFCVQATANSYPFNRNSAADLSMQDFGQLFGPGGKIDTFFNANLAKFVDTSGRQWIWKKADNADLGISQAVLTQLQYAADIRTAFFPAGPAPKVSFQMTPEALDPKAQGIVLDIDGQKMAFKHSDGAPEPAAVNWPGSVGLARVTFEPTSSSSESTFSRDGPWALFRMLDAVEIRKTNVSDRKRVIFKVGGRIAIYQMQSSSVINPFALPAMAKFNCPTSF